LLDSVVFLFYKTSKNFKISKVAYGIGNRDTEIPNVLRVYLCELIEPANISNEYVLECNIDDMNPEMYDFVFETLFENGAMDVFLTPIIMKKLRPANTLSVICNSENKEKLKEIIFANTTTIGMREYIIEKTMLRRETEIIETKFGKIKIKNAYLKNKKISSKPEYEDCKRLAKENNVSINEIYNSINFVSIGKNE